MANTVEVIVCRCRGAQDNALDEGKLQELLAKNKRVSNVHVIDHLCSGAGMQSLSGKVTGGSEAGLVVAACAAEPLYRKLISLLPSLGIPRQAFEIVPIRDWALWAHPGDRSTAAANDAIRMATARVKASKNIGQWSLNSAFINRLGCDKCKRCIEECPAQACVLGEDGYPVIEPELCRRCGLCVGSCPKQVISLPDLRVEEVSAGLRVLKGDGTDEPTVLAFCCEPLTYPALVKKAGQGLKLPNNMRVIKVSCMGAVNMALVSDALSSGIDSVLLMGCKEGACRLRRGDELAVRRMENLRETLERMMVDMSRVRYIGWPESICDGVVVDAQRCNGCLACQSVCPFDAVVSTEKIVAGKLRKVTERNETACRSCGTCMAGCPSGACQPVEMTDTGILDEIDAACWGGVRPAKNEAVILCNCLGDLNAHIDYGGLTSKLNNAGLDRVVVVDHLCTPEAWTVVGEKLSNGYGGTVIVGACAEEYFGQRMRKYAHDAGLFPSTFEFVDFCDLSATKQPVDGVDVCANALFGAVARVRKNRGKPELCDNALTACLTEQVENLRAMGPNPFRE